MTLTRFGLREWGLSGLAALVLIAAFISVAGSMGADNGFFIGAFRFYLLAGAGGFFSQSVPRDTGGCAYAGQSR